MMNLKENPSRVLGLCTGILMLVLLGGCGTTAPRDKAPMDLTALSETQKQSYAQALTALQNEQPDLAEQSLAPLARQFPEVAELKLNLALAQYHQERFEPALQSLQPLLRRNPSIASAHNLAGLIAVHQGRFKDAEQHYQTALAAQPNYTNALYNLALLHDVYFQQVAEAVVYYERYMARVEDDQETSNWLQHLRLSLGGE